MNGVQIISQEAITTTRDIPTLLLILSMFIILPITFYFGKKTDNWNVACTLGIATAIIYGIIVMMILSSGLFKKPSGYYKNTVKISNECRLLEFNEQFKIIKENKDGTYLITDDLDYRNWWWCTMNSDDFEKAEKILLDNHINGYPHGIWEYERYYEIMYADRNGDFHRKRFLKELNKGD